MSDGGARPDRADPDAGIAATYRSVLDGDVTGSGHRPGRDATDDGGADVTRLIELGLVQVDAAGGLVAVSPMLAEAAALGADEVELDARRVALERRRDAIRRLVPVWNEARTASADTGIVDVVLDPAAQSNVLMHHAEHAERELLSIGSARGPASRIDGRVRLANVFAARRGITTRGLVHHLLLRDRGVRDHLVDLARSGAGIRVAASVPARGLIADRSVAMLIFPLDGAPAAQALAVVREPSVLAWLVAAFEQVWCDAQPLEAVLHTDSPLVEFGDTAEPDATRVAILRLMAEGEKDEAIARRLAISVRTCRRHIADYMSQVGATSRFQAGVIAARAGHTDLPSG